MIVDSYKFLPRSFRPLYEGRGPLPGEEAAVWTPFPKRLSESRIALLTSAGVYVGESQLPFDVEREQSEPEWGDPSWRAIPATARAGELAVAHLHVNEDDVIADPEIALPTHALAALAREGVVAAAASDHVSVMGYQERSLGAWRELTAPAIAAHLRAQGADALVLAPA